MCHLSLSRRYFNLSRTVQSFERNFAIVSKEYTKINHTFNREKSDVVLFNWGETRAGLQLISTARQFPQNHK